jgi:hypothetical protein
LGRLSPGQLNQFRGILFEIIGQSVSRRG